MSSTFPLPVNGTSLPKISPFLSTLSGPETQFQTMAASAGINLPNGPATHLTNVASAIESGQTPPSPLPTLPTQPIKGLTLPTLPPLPTVGSASGSQYVPQPVGVRNVNVNPVQPVVNVPPIPPAPSTIPPTSGTKKAIFF